MCALSSLPAVCAVCVVHVGYVGYRYGTDCDDPSRRMRRSISAFEIALGVRAPERLHACAEAQRLKLSWDGTCGAGSMLEATEWLANATRKWREDAV